MKQIGTRHAPTLSMQGSDEALATGARFSEALALMAKSSFIPKGMASLAAACLAAQP